MAPVPWAKDGAAKVDWMCKKLTQGDLGSSASFAKLERRLLQLEAKYTLHLAPDALVSKQQACDKLENKLRSLSSMRPEAPVRVVDSAGDLGKLAMCPSKLEGVTDANTLTPLLANGLKTQAKEITSEPAGTKAKHCPVQPQPPHPQESNSYNMKLDDLPKDVEELVGGGLSRDLLNCSSAALLDISGAVCCSVALSLSAAFVSFMGVLFVVGAVCAIGSLASDFVDCDGRPRAPLFLSRYKTVPVRLETPVSEVIELLCKRLSAGGGRHADPGRSSGLARALAGATSREAWPPLLLSTALEALRERRLLPEDRPLSILEGERRLLRRPGGDKDSGGSMLEMETPVPERARPSQDCNPAFKFVFREAPDPARAAWPATDAAADAEAEATQEAIYLGAAACVPSADVCTRLRTGALERRDEGSGAWHPCTALLDEEHFWYSLAASGEDGGGVGGGMAHLTLLDCEQGPEAEDKRVFRLAARGGGALELRARSTSERSSWLRAITRQATLVKERALLAQAERTLAALERRSAEAQLARLEALRRLPDLLEVEEARELFLQFARAEHARSRGRAGAEAAGGAGGWPEAVTREALEACLENGGGDSGDAAWEFARGDLLRRFRAHPAVRCRMCRIAAGMGPRLGGAAMGAPRDAPGALAEDPRPGAKGRGARAAPAPICTEEDPAAKPAHRSRCCWCPFLPNQGRPHHRPATASPATVQRGKAKAWLAEEAASFTRARQETRQAAIDTGGARRGFSLEPNGDRRRTRSWLFAKGGSLESIESLQPLEEESLPPLEDSALLAALVAQGPRRVPAGAGPPVGRCSPWPRLDTPSSSGPGRARGLALGPHANPTPTPLDF
ncbi:unnamed protein product [Prorocentrum cordatum]|uniref:PH domain-containing protein n=1 Tax=Prorocentrum cordatum TaxID=2364126 RepID=A0ABN9TME5_9DINO|nr:unnamed protein product [Polarella glacialis]